MNKYRNKLLTAMQLGSIVLLALFVAASARAQASATRPANGTRGDIITPPPVPPDIRVPEGNEAFLVGHGVGTQNYVCLPCDPTKPDCTSGVAFKLFTPQATLFDDQGEQLTTHFFSPNPNESGIVRVTWEHSRDTSTVWGRVDGSKIVTDGAIPWLLVNVKDIGTQAGPTGGDKLTKTTFIQRLNTVGGVAPSTDCIAPSDIGHQAFVPYRADYFFFKAVAKPDDN